MARRPSPKKTKSAKKAPVRRPAAKAAPQAQDATEATEAPKDTTPKRRGPYKATPAEIRKVEERLVHPVPKPAPKAKKPSKPLGRAKPKPVASAEGADGASVQRELLEKVRANGGSLNATPQTFD